jgi:tRNA(Ile)-lysidine synthase
MPLLNNSCPNLGEAIQTLTKAFQSTQEELLQRNKTLIEEIKENSCWPFSSFDSLSREERILVGRSLGWTVRDILELESKRNASKSTMHLSHNKQSIVKESTQWNWSEINQVAWKLNIKQVDLLPAEFAKNVIYLDGDKIIGELHLRFPKTGDKIFSIGLEGSQLVSKVLKDAKWELKQRQQALLLCDEKNIHWVHGLKVGRKALASAASQRILKITVEQSH